ncbi:prepilin peptidase [Rhodobacteraceae bacterium 2376]|uniref:Protein translocase subunit SecA n=1 Tax=Rhabdonatronobacter sediminivivens TaxID=2743469 RepID=A0A7Z0I1S7_9RHOB|nr:prepilin peptidase [Rhabdonatronobacter sediminivivens]NYS26012.1 prepilin peptidase [Rhabdonatronobacter sediminivivens]
MSEGVRPLPLGLTARCLLSERAVTVPHWTEKLVDACVAPVIARTEGLRARRMRRIIPAVEEFAGYYAAATPEEMREATAALRWALRKPGGLEDVGAVGSAFALVREASARVTGMRHFPVQLMGGYALLTGHVAEMATGEGKTLTATLAAATAALAGLPVHVVTVNDYLAARDAEAMGPIFEAMGLTVGLVQHGQSPEERRAAYRADVTYATNKELAFDYLRDRIALGKRYGELRLRARRLSRDQGPAGQLLLRGLHFAIVDEADSIFIDEARTPLIISGEAAADERLEMAPRALEIARTLRVGADFTLQRNRRRADLTPAGTAQLERVVAGEGWRWQNPVLREEMVTLALAALHLFHDGEAYVVQQGKVAIVDEFTGRIMPDRNWGEGLHQLIELKEGVEMTRPRVPQARITYQRLFRRYRRLSGMTGTAREVGRELWSVFRLPVVPIPTARPDQRRILPAQILPDADAKWRVITRRCLELQARGQPVLLGTRSVLASKLASEYLTRAGLAHQVLNAVQNRDEAAIIARAGAAGSITVATNMAGRGTDILIPTAVAALGGLHVIMSERHEAARIDRQLAGRTARQGAPGSFEVILSLDDALLQHSPFAALAGRIPGTRGKLLASRLAQRWAEGIHRKMRHRLLQHDEQSTKLMSFSGRAE